MKLEIRDGIVRGLPLAILFTFLLQGGAAVWWLSAKARDGYFMEQRVDRIETVVGHVTEAQGQAVERLARIEERLSAQTVLLTRIDKQLAARQ